MIAILLLYLLCLFYNEYNLEKATTKVFGTIFLSLRNLEIVELVPPFITAIA